MRYGLLTLGLLLMAWLGFVMALQSNRNSILGLNARLKAEADYSPEYWHKEWQRLGVAARERALLYEQELEKDHLLDAMVVNRHRDGRVASECDSLLFSSLRYVALLKLGWQDKADAAWQGIEGAYQKGRWARHPKCQDRSTSRDMIVGLLVALSQHPPRDRQHLQTLLDIVRDTGGSIDDGPFYVSRLSPGIGEIIRLMAVNHSIPLNNLPDEIRLGFSTLELDVLTANIGFTSHLNALCLWIELELRNEAVSTPIRNLSEVLDALGLGSPKLEAQRMEWIAQRLEAMDRNNLFFVWLRLKSANALTWKSEAFLLEKLLAMPQFPEDQLPRNCDRTADYLWQRSSAEYARNPKTDCHETFSGVDFLWMTALLTEKL